MEDYPNANSFYTNTLEILEKSLTSDYFLIASSYGNIGLAYSI